MDGPTSRAQEVWGTGLPWEEELQGGPADGQLPTYGGWTTEDGHSGKSKVGEMLGDCGAPFGSDRLVGSLATWFRGHSTVVLFLLQMVTSSTPHTKSRAL